MARAGIKRFMAGNFQVSSAGKGEFARDFCKGCVCGD